MNRQQLEQPDPNVSSVLCQLSVHETGGRTVESPQLLGPDLQRRWTHIVRLLLASAGLSLIRIAIVAALISDMVESNDFALQVFRGINSITSLVFFVLALFIVALMLLYARKRNIAQKMIRSFALVSIAGLLLSFMPATLVLFAFKLVFLPLMAGLLVLGLCILLAILKDMYFARPVQFVARKAILKTIIIVFAVIGSLFSVGAAVGVLVAFLTALMWNAMPDL